MTTAGELSSLLSNLTIYCVIFGNSPELFLSRYFIALWPRFQTMQLVPFQMAEMPYVIFLPLTKYLCVFWNKAKLEILSGI